MTRFIEHKTSSGRVIKTRPNYAKKHFTIKTDVATHRTKNTYTMKKLFKSNVSNNNGEEMVISIDTSNGTGAAELKLWGVDWDNFFDLEMWEGGSISIEPNFTSIEINGDNGLIIFEPLEIFEV